MPRRSQGRGDRQVTNVKQDLRLTFSCSAKRQTCLRKEIQGRQTAIDRDERSVTLAIGELHVAQEDGGLPTTLAMNSALGESGVSILSQWFRDGVHVEETPRQHHVCFQMSPLYIERRLGSHALRYQAPAGGLAICPAGIDAAVDTEQSVAIILVAIDPCQLALAAAEGSALGARLIQRLSGYDLALLRSARILASESADNYPNGPLFWSDVASNFIEGLVARHTSAPSILPRSILGKDALDRLKDYIVAHLDSPLDVATLAAVAGQSQYHFSRVFARSVGVTPHRYVVRLRLQRAMELIRSGRSGLAEIAVRTGFADQSHLSRWLRRVHGVSLTQLRSPGPEQRSPDNGRRPMV
jgi:AraC family transcriptional regulator